MDEEKYGKVVDLICEIYESDKKNLLLLLIHLENQERLLGSRHASSKWKMLYDLVGNKKAFKMFADAMIEQIRGKNDQYIVEIASKSTQVFPHKIPYNEGINIRKTITSSIKEDGHEKEPFDKNKKTESKEEDSETDMKFGLFD